MLINNIKKISILGVYVNSDPFAQLKHNIQVSLKSSNVNLFIATVNASFILKAKTNTNFKTILNTTAFNTADGVSIQLAAEYLDSTKKYSNYFVFAKVFIYFIVGLSIGFKHTLFKQPFKVVPNRITGVKLTQYLLNLCQKQNKKLVIAHYKDSLTSYDLLDNYLASNYPKLIYKIILVPKPFSDVYSTAAERCDVLLCTLGEVSQEKYINATLSIYKPSVAVGVGSTFDLLTGRLKSPNLVIKSMGLEWLFRLIVRPKRALKIARSVILFPTLVYFYSIKTRDEM